LGERQGELQAAISSGNEVFETTAQRNQELAATIRALPPFLEQLQRTAGILGGAGGDLTGAATALGPAVPHLAPGLSAINGVAPEFRGIFRALPGVISAGRTGLPSGQRLVNAAGPFLSEAYPTLREVIPFLQLLSVDRDTVAAFFGNIANWGNVNYVGPGNK